jgi:hypothetical protein
LIDFVTTGVGSYSAAAPVQVTITNNKILDDQYGIRVDSPPVSAAGTSSNLCVDVANDLANG